MSSDEDEEVRIRAEVIEAMRKTEAELSNADIQKAAEEESALEEQKLRPIREEISEAEKGFDSELEAFNRKYDFEAQTLSGAIDHHNKRSEKIHKEMDALSTSLKENEQNLRDVLAEAEQLDHANKERQEKFELDRRTSMAPIHDKLHGAQAELHLKRNTRDQKLEQARLTKEKILEDAILHIRRPSGTFSSIERPFSTIASALQDETLTQGKAIERHAFICPGSRATTRPLMGPPMTSNGATRKESQQVTAVNRDRFSLPEKKNFMSHEKEHSEPIQQTPIELTELEVESDTVYIANGPRERSATGSSLTILGESPIEPFTNTRSSCPTGDHSSEEVVESIEFAHANGFFASPEYMKGVPLAKFIEGDNYWDPEWTKLEDWFPNVRNNVGRDKSVAFFSTCQIHPNQLLGKKYYELAGLCARSYPIILRCVLQVLERRNIVDPIKWLRQRLAPLIAINEKDEGPGNFNLGRTLENFQKSNPAYRELYEKNKHKSSSYNQTKSKATTIQPAPRTKRSLRSTSSSPTEHPSKLPRLGSPGSSNIFDVPEEDVITVARSRNRDYRQLSPLSLDPAMNHVIKASVSADRIRRDGSNAITHGDDSVLFDLYSTKVGDREWDDDPPNLKLDAASGLIEPVRPFLGNLSTMMPELVVHAASIQRVAFATAREVGDSMRLKCWLGEGLKMQLVFRDADDAVVFAFLLSAYNRKVQLSEDDSKRIAYHGFHLSD